MDRVLECNVHDKSEFVPVKIDGVVVGHVKPRKVDILTSISDVFKMSQKCVVMSNNIYGNEERTHAMANVAQKLIEIGEIKSLRNEIYSVLPAWIGPSMMHVDRSLVSWFGFPSIGVHLNGIVRLENQIFMWISHRSKNMLSFPSKLDNLVAGGHGVSMDLNQTLYSECIEEAGISRDIASQAVQVGVVTFCVEHDIGLRRGIVFCYDLSLSRSWYPQCESGESNKFELLPLEQVAEIVRETNKFKFNSSLVIIDYLVRSGFINSSNIDIVNIISNLRKSVRKLMWI